jgi:putative membrane protein
MFWQGEPIHLLIINKHTPGNTMKTNRMTFAVLLLLAAGSLTTIAADQKSSLKSADEKFVKKAAASGTAEVKVATLGTQKAERADVKELAQMLITDHTKANEELTALAQSKGVELSAVIDPKAAETFQKLEKKSGKDFDKAFLSQLEDDHQACISDFEDAEKNGTDGEVKSWASGKLPTLRAHLAKVKELEAK